MRGEMFSTNHVLGALFAFACGTLAGYILLAFWPRNKKFYGSMLWMGLLCLIIGLLTLQLPVFTKNYISYVAAYTVILGGCQGKLRKPQVLCWSYFHIAFLGKILLLILMDIL
jgi:hypothetical protein